MDLWDDAADLPSQPEMDRRRLDDAVYTLLRLLRHAVDPFQQRRVLRMLRVVLRLRPSDLRELPPKLEPRDVKSLPDGDFVQTFRFEKDHFPDLIRAYNIPEHVFLKKERLSFSAWDAVGVMLRRLAFPCRWHDVKYLFGRHASHLSAIFNWTLEHAFQHSGDRVRKLSRSYLTDERLKTLSDALQSKGCPYTRMFGFVDGTCDTAVLPCSTL